jgi:CDP-glycerol glycerophosphotransferase
MISKIITGAKKFMHGSSKFRSPLKVIQLPIKLVMGMISRFVPKKRGLIIFCSDRYNENSRYLFEYMATHKIEDVYWIAYDKKIISYLESKQLPCLGVWYKQIWALMRADVVVSSGNTFWDRYGAVTKPTIRYCLMHGCGPKVTEYYGDFDVSIRVLNQINKFDFVNFPSDFSAEVVGKCIFKLPANKIVINGYPRHDQLFSSDEKDYLRVRDELRSECDINFEFETDAQIILYAPTFRKYDRNYSFPIAKLLGYDAESFGHFLKSNKIYLFYTKHPQTNVGIKNELPSCSNFVPISYDDNKLFDISYFMIAFDCLINDYSTTGVDFSILKRPQIFVLPDFENFKRHDAFVEDYMAAINQQEINTYDELISKLMSIKTANQYTMQHPIGFNKYWDIGLSQSCEKNAVFLSDLCQD